MDIPKKYLISGVIKDEHYGWRSQAPEHFIFHGTREQGEAWLKKHGYLLRYVTEDAEIFKKYFNPPNEKEALQEYSYVAFEPEPAHNEQLFWEIRIDCYFVVPMNHELAELARQALIEAITEELKEGTMTTTLDETTPGWYAFDEIDGGLFVSGKDYYEISEENLANDNRTGHDAGNVHHSGDSVDPVVKPDQLP